MIKWNTHFLHQTKINWQPKYVRKEQDKAQPQSDKHVLTVILPHSFWYRCDSRCLQSHLKKIVYITYIEIKLWRSGLRCRLVLICSGLNTETLLCIWRICNLNFTFVYDISKYIEKQIMPLPPTSLPSGAFSTPAL